MSSLRTMKRMQERKEKNAGKMPKMPKMPKILIGVPSNRDLCKEFIASLLGLLRTVGIDNVVFMQNGMINQCRDSIVKYAVSKGYEYIFWIDDDMIVPPNTIEKLLAHDKDIVAGLYFGRGNYLPVMYDLKREIRPEAEEPYTFSDYTYEFKNHIEYTDDDLMQVGAVGFGCVLTKVSALVKVWKDERDGIGGTCFDFIGSLGEDLSFGIRCLECGIDTWVDTSIKCGHMGKITVTEDMFKSLALAKKPKEEEEEDPN